MRFNSFYRRFYLGSRRQPPGESSDAGWLRRRSRGSDAGARRLIGRRTPRALKLLPAEPGDLVTGVAVAVVAAQLVARHLHGHVQLVSLLDWALVDNTREVLRADDVDGERVRLVHPDLLLRPLGLPALRRLLFEHAVTTEVFEELAAAR